MSDHRWEAGAQFDNYTLERRLGAGGNGDVWLAYETLPDDSRRAVAIKALRAGISSEPTRVERFKREVSIMARIDSAHIVKVFTFGELGGQLYVIMPYMSGGTLRERLVGQPLSLMQSLHWLEQVGYALDYVHDRYHGLIHRDVKPENMLIGEDGETLHLADFGLVFSLKKSDQRLTDEGKPAGTGRYMAPEQWRNQPLTRQTDLYALGIVAYELLTGHLPYEYDNDFDLGVAHCEYDLPEDPQLSPEVLRILQRATAKSPADRYPTARAFLDDLRNWDVDPANLEPRIDSYLDWLVGDIRERMLERFVELSGEEIQLRRVDKPRRRKHYIDLDELDQHSTTVQADHVTEAVGQVVVENVRERLRTIDRAVLIGEPGSGKSFMLQRLCVDYAMAWLEAYQSGADVSSAKIPVLVYLNEYTGGRFTDFVKAALDTLAPYYDKLLRENRIVLLCDALNEMPRKRGQKRQLIDYLEQMSSFVVSCRVRDYRDDLDKLSEKRPMEKMLLRDLELPAIHELVTKRLPDGQGEMLWREMGGTDALMDFWEQGYGDKFWDPKSFYSWPAPEEWMAMHRGARLIPLARNPYMADLLCRTYHKGDGKLPTSRAQLFGQFVQQMLQREANAAARRGDPFPDFADIDAALVELARNLQGSGRTIIPWGAALNHLITPDLLDVAVNANILNNEGDYLRFAHHLLQEYFAAKGLLEMLETDEREGTYDRVAQVFGDDWWDAGVWRETIVILGEFIGGVAGANRVVRWLAPITPELALDVITRNGAGLTLEHDLEAPSREALVRGAAYLTTEPDSVGRAAAYRVLGELVADGRPGVAVRRDGTPDILWSELIPPDDYAVGGDSLAYDSLDGETYTLTYSYHVSKYPVTYLQFEAFLDDDDGYHSQTYDWFEGLNITERGRQLLKQSFRYSNHPREQVNWYQALAFCRWLSWRMTGRFYTVDEIAVWPVRLPTEKEWEIAAREPQTQLPPVPEKKGIPIGNTTETGIGQTTAVGIFSLGTTWCGALDMQGNVWEWCLNPYDAPDDGLNPSHVRSGARRVLRGGSWYFVQQVARPASRFNFDPLDGYDFNGFRLLMLPHLLED